MAGKETLDNFSNGKVFDFKGLKESKDIPWSPHPAFEGVSLKHLVKGESTENTFSAHIVKIEPGEEIGAHIHEANWELHEVIEGEGVCIFEGTETEYKPGVCAVMPQGKNHRVVAGKDGMHLLAKFIPALL